MARHRGVTWAFLAEPGYVRTLAAELVLFALVMLAAAGHGIDHSKGRTELTRARAVVALAGSLGVVLLATALPAARRFRPGPPDGPGPDGPPVAPKETTDGPEQATWPAAWGRSTLLPERWHGAGWTQQREPGRGAVAKEP
ncbi:hypothetical protein [Streptomyces prasinus]|uniref:hypothetical protein n=1 Tax=Streptomyces prasinus TaxID=67345 RepID=UPI0006EB63CC|nr:hypothetical protein [Streptomyces prasinus]